MFALSMNWLFRSDLDSLASLSRVFRQKLAVWSEQFVCRGMRQALVMFSKSQSCSGSTKFDGVMACCRNACISSERLNGTA